MANEFSRKRVAKAIYSFTADGGAVGTIIPSAESDIIPIGAVITSVIANVTTALTSGGSATLAITAGGITIAGSTPAAYSAAPWNGTVPGSLVQSTGITGTAVYIPQVTTASSEIAIVIATAALTAGAFTIIVEYTL